jgi:hypothetical protein
MVSAVVTVAGGGRLQVQGSLRNARSCRDRGRLRARTRRGGQRAQPGHGDERERGRGGGQPPQPSQRPISPRDGKLLPLSFCRDPRHPVKLLPVSNRNVRRL